LALAGGLSWARWCCCCCDRVAGRMCACSRERRALAQPAPRDARAPSCAAAHRADHGAARRGASSTTEVSAAPGRQRRCLACTAGRQRRTTYVLICDGGQVRVESAASERILMRCGLDTRAECAPTAPRAADAAAARRYRPDAAQRARSARLWTRRWRQQFSGE
jgi:hypothetical protein